MSIIAKVRIADYSTAHKIEAMPGVQILSTEYTDDPWIAQKQKVTTEYGPSKDTIPSVILEALKNGPKTTGQLRDVLRSRGMNPDSVDAALYNMRERGLIHGAKGAGRSTVWKLA